MDPITKALVDYIEHLSEGGFQAYIGDISATQRQIARRLHPSALGPGLCDRAAAYDVMKDLGEIEVEPWPPEKQLFFQIGHIFQGFVAEALEHGAALINTEVELTSKDFVGRPDIIADGYVLTGDASAQDWVIDVKAVGNKYPGGLTGGIYPNTFSIAQVEKYAEMMSLEGTYKPVLFYISKLFFETALFSWEWKGDDCIVYVWKDESWEYDRTYAGLRVEMRESVDAQIKWLRTGELPNRCGATPHEHPFKCVKKVKGWAHPDCPYYQMCWDLEPVAYKIKNWGKEPQEEVTEDDIW